MQSIGGINLEVFLLRLFLQQLHKRQVLIGVFLLLPKLQHLLHLVTIEFQPLPAKPHQRGFGFQQGVPLFRSHGFASDGDLIIKLNQ